MSNHREGSPSSDHPTPRILSTAQWNAPAELRLEPIPSPIPEGTLGDFGLTVKVLGPAEFPPTIVVAPFERRRLAGIDGTSVRGFRWNGTSFRPIWRSGVNLGLGFAWAEISRPDVLSFLGLPSDKLLRQVLQTLARQRLYLDGRSPEEMQALTESVLGVFVDTREEDLEGLRRQLAVMELQTGLIPPRPNEVPLGRGGHVDPPYLPGGASLREFRDRLRRLKTPFQLPEEALFFHPELLFDSEPWSLKPPLTWPLPLPTPFPQPFPKPFPWPWPWLCWFWSRNWWMYHHDAQHTGASSGCSGIRSTTVQNLHLRTKLCLDGPVISIPSVVDGKVYVGTGNNAIGGGTLYRVDLLSGNIDLTFPTSGTAYYMYPGIGGSPAVVGGKVYFTALHGKVYCLDANTFAPQWVVNLKQPDLAHNQPVVNPVGDCWTSPLVVNGKMYVGSGEGEAGAFGFVWCLDANTGVVQWLFCTNRFDAAVDNAPNVIPASAIGAVPLPAPFVSHPDPPHRGASVWSSCAYDPVLNRIFVGTGNSSEHGLPDDYYGTGVLALDANTGAFQGFFQPSVATSYRPGDSDIDIPASPMLFTRNGTHVLAIGCKSGAFFLLNPATMSLLHFRQMLPHDAAGNPYPAIDPGGAGGGENYYGVFTTAALHHGLGRLFVGVGGYGGAIDSTTTPFMRALDWMDLKDAWTTALAAPHKYTSAIPPMYTTPGEAGLSSPAVVNDVVFVCTSKPEIYAFDATTGVCLWAGNLGPGDNSLGPVISGNFVVVGSANWTTEGNLYLYSL